MVTLPELPEKIPFALSAFSRGLHTLCDLFGKRYRPTLRLPMSTTLVRDINRRTAVRYRLRLPVIFHWNDGVEHTEGGFTNDVALDGALIVSSRCPPIGADVRIEVLIPAPHESEEEIRIECVGKVMRVRETRAGTSTFGVHGLFSDEQLTQKVSSRILDSRNST